MLCGPKDNEKHAGKQAAQELLDSLKDGGCVDGWMQDQLILFMALAKGTSTMLTGSLTQHTQTAIHLAKQMVPGVLFEVKQLDVDKRNASSTNNDQSGNGPGKDGKISGKHLITCHGIGFTGIK